MTKQHADNNENLVPSAHAVTHFKKDALQNYAAILHSIHDLVFVLNVNRVITDFFQPPLEKLYIPPASFLQKKIDEIPAPAEVLLEINKKIDAVVITGSTQTMDYYLPWPQGLRWYNANISGIYSNDNALQGFVLVVADTTDSVLQKNRFLAILEKYNLAVKAANFGIWEFNYLTSQFYWDEVMEMFFECKLSSIQQFQQTWLKLLQPECFTELLTSFKNALKTGEDFHAVFSVKVGGKLKYIETYACFQFNANTKRSDKVTGIALDITDKKLAELALRKSEEHYRMLADNITDIVVLHQIDGTVNYMSPSAIRVLGNTLEEAQQEGGMFFIHPDDTETVIQQNKKILDGGESCKPYECRIRHKQGHYVTFEIVNKAVKDDNGSPVGILSVCRDITARKMAEDHYRMLAENVTDIIGLLNLEGNFEYISPSIHRLLGYTQQEITGASPFDIIHPDDVEPLKINTIAKNLQGEEGCYSGYRVKHINGNWVYFDVVSKPVYNGEGKITHILKSSRDVTQRTLAEKAQRESEEQYKLLADNMGDLIVLLSPALKRQYISPSCLELTGYTVAEFITGTLDDIIHPGDKESFFTGLGNTILKGEDRFKVQYRIQHKKGHWVYVESLLKAIKDGECNLVNILSTTRDITKKEEAKAALRKSEQLYRMLADNARDVIALHGKDGNYIYVSPSVKDILGYTPEELIGKGPSETMHPDDLTILNINEEMILRLGEANQSITFRKRRKDGEWIYYETTFKLIKDEKGEPVNFLTTSRDVTEKHKYHIAVEESEKQYRMLADNIVDMVVLLTPDHKRVYLSPSSSTLLGYTAVELLEQLSINVFHSPADEAVIRDAENRILQGSEQEIRSYSLRHKNGDKIDVEAIIKGIRNEQGAVIHFLLTVRNVTRQVAAEQALRKSEEHYRMLADNIVDTVILLTPEDQRIYVSPSCLQLTGFTPAELLATNPKEKVIYSAEDEAVLRAAKKEILSGGGQRVVQYRLLRKNGEIITVETIVKDIRDADGNLTNFLLTIGDVTRRVEAEKRLRSSEEQYRVLADNIVDMVAMYDENGIRLYVSPSSKYLLGYNPSELLGHDSSDIMDPDDMNKLRVDVIERAKQTQQEKFFFSARLRHKFGYYLYCEITIKAIRDSENIVTSFVATTRNVTEWKNDQKALFESEQRYRTLADNMTDMLVLYTPEFKRVYVSPSSLSLAGYTPSEMMGVGERDLIYGEDLERVQECVQENIRNRIDDFKSEFRIRHKSGEIKYVSSSVNVIRDNAGKIVNILTTARDITPEKKAQMAMQESEQKYRMLADNIFDMLVLYTPDFKRVYVSPSSLQLTGFTPVEMVGQTAFSIIHPEDVDGVTKKVRSSIAEGTDRFTCEFRGVHKDGSFKYISSFFTVIRDAGGAILNILSTTRDVTPEKKAQIALKENEEKYRSLVEASEDIILIMDENGQYLFANEIACKYVDASLDKVLSSTIYDFFDAGTAARYIESIRRVLKTGAGFSFETEITINGKQIWLRNTLQPIKDSAANVKAAMLCLVDITDIKLYTEALRKQNEELKKIAYLQSHIVRAPLANMQGLMSLLDESKLDRETGLYIHLLKEAAMQLDTIVKDIVERAIEVKNKPIS